MNKSKHLTFRCTPEQYSKIKKLAQGKSLSAWIIERLITYDINDYLKDKK